LSAHEDFVGILMNVFRSLTAKLMVIYVPLVCVSILALFAVLEIRYVQDQKADLAEKLDKLLTVESAAFSTPAWEFDLDSIELLMKAISLDGDIQDVSIYDARGGVIAKSGDENARALIDILRGERELTYKSGNVTETVGKLVITFHQDRINHELMKRIQIDAMIVFALAAILLTIIWGTTRRVIGNPLSQLQRSIETAKEGGGRERVAWDSADELGQVVRAYNEMQEGQTAAEAEVARYRDHLEALVAERTSELETSQSELSRKTDILQAVLDSISQGLAAFDADLKLIAWNSKYLEVRGYPADFAEVGRPFEEFIQYDVAQKEFGEGDPDLQFNEQVDRAKLFQAHEFERQRPSGQTIEIRGGPIPGGGFVSTYADITDRKQAEAELAEKEAQLRLALDNMTGGILLIDSSFNLQVYNDNFAKLYELPDQLVYKGAPLKQIVQFRADRGDYGSGNVGQLVRDRLLGYVRQERVQLEDSITGKRTLENLRAPSGDGGTVSIFNDITDRKKAEEDLRRAHGLITESIGYASRIQRSVLPAESTLRSIFADHFVIWEPKDVVGGDMFWHRKCEDGELVIAADCTGHGVPGAFMTMIATGALDQALVEIPTGYPSAVLQRMNQLIQGVLGQDSDEGESDDGLELGVCHIDSVSGEMMFAGARFFLWQLKDGEITEIKGNKSGIAYRHVPPTVSFETKIIDLTPDTSFYMISDGMIDQIGGEKRRSFGKKRIRQLILESGDLPMAEQRKKIYRGFIDYQGDEERRDDVTLVGFKSI
jgi:PAS domain S-box-containing protein